MGIRDRFKAIAAKRAQERRDGMAAPQELFEKQIKTREMLDWMDRRAPDTPALEYTPDDNAAREHGQRENGKLAKGMRRRFYRRSQKAREDFGTAHDFSRKRSDPERER